MALRILFGILSSVGILLAAGIGWQLRRRTKSRKPETLAAIVASGSPLAALQHSDWQVRLRAVQSLAAAHEPGVLTALITRLADPDQDVRAAVVEAIAGYETQALPSLTAVLADGERTAREMAVETLARIGGQPALPGLLQALHDESGWVRGAAVRALANIRDKRVISALTEALHDPYAEVAQAARLALEHIGTPAAKRALKDNPSPALPIISAESTEGDTSVLMEEEATRRKSWNAITR